MKRLAIVAAGLVAPTAVMAQAAAPAQAPAGSAPAAGAAVAAGATVRDTAGGTVGTVASIDGTNAVIDTGTVKAAVPLASLATGPTGPVLGLTKVQLEAAAGQQQAQAGAAFRSKLVTGATVYGTGGAQLGTIKSVAGDNVTLTTPQGDAALPVSGFGPGPQGVTLGMTQQQLQAAMTAAGAGTAAAGGSATTGTTAASGTETTAATTGTATDTSATATAETGSSGKKSRKPR